MVGPWLQGATGTAGSLHSALDNGIVASLGLSPRVNHLGLHFLLRRLSNLLLELINLPQVEVNDGELDH